MKRSASQHADTRNVTSNSKVRRSRAASTSSSSSESSTDDEREVEWVGESFVSEKGTFSYGEVKVDGDSYQIGESVFVEVEEWDKFQPAVLQYLWEDENGDMWGWGNWYYLAAELNLKVNNFEGELFESSYGDAFPVLALQGKVRLTDNPEKAKTGKYHLCRYFYDPNLRNLTKRAVTSDSGKEFDEQELAVESGPFAKALFALELSAIPDVMPCRDHEKSAIEAYILNGIRNGGSQYALYVSGLPGTGKTATVHEVIENLRRKGDLPKFKVTEINALRLSVPEEAYCVLAAALFPNNPPVCASKACQNLQSYFAHSDARRLVHVVVIDEIDNLLTKKQQLLYNLFDWPQKLNSKLVIVGVSNTMNFPEQLLPRIQSRMGKERVLFQSYTREQIEIIIKQRLADSDVFERNALEFASRKVASVSGDVRRALQLCRRAITLCAQLGATQVSMEHINQAVKEIDSRPQFHLVSQMSPLEKLILISVHKHCVSCDVDQVLFQDIYMRMTNMIKIVPELCSLASVPGFGRQTLFVLCQRLAHDNYIKTDWSTCVSTGGPLLWLSFDYEDIRGAIMSDNIVAQLA